MIKPLLSVHVQDEIQAQLAVQAGANHLIWAEPTGILARKRPSFPFSASVTEAIDLEMIIRQKDFAKITALLPALMSRGYQIFRLSDVGLASYLRKQWPALQLHLSGAANLKNSASLQVLNQIFQRIGLSNELTLTELSSIRRSTSADLEILVHGPILVQQSARRYLSGCLATEPSLPTAIIDQDHPDKIFLCRETKSGSQIYNYFERCLAEHLPALCDLGLESWLIDTRNSASLYSQRVFQLYAAGRQGELAPALWSAVQKMATRPLAPGFFLDNQTDQSYKRSDVAVQQRSFGIVIDVTPPWLVIEIQFPVTTWPSEVLYCTPENKKLVCCDFQPLNIDGQPLQAVQPGQLIKAAYLKGIIAQTQVGYEIK